MCSSVGLGLTLLPTLHTFYMACRGSGVRVSLAPFFKKPVHHWHLSGPVGPLFSAKPLNIIFYAPKCAPNGRKWSVACWLNWTEQLTSMQMVADLNPSGGVSNFNGSWRKLGAVFILRAQTGAQNVELSSDSRTGFNVVNRLPITAAMSEVLSLFQQ